MFQEINFCIYYLFNKITHFIPLINIKVEIFYPTHKLYLMQILYEPEIFTSKVPQTIYLQELHPLYILKILQVIRQQYRIIIHYSGGYETIWYIKTMTFSIMLYEFGRSF